VSANGNVICTLCRRQFTSPELLQRHERESKLHAENLAKSKLSQDSESAVYRDRASERRAIHGQSEIPEDILDPGRRDDIFNSGERRKRRAGSVTDLMVDNSSALVAASSVPPPVLSDDVNNPGNQLLRRMGWNEGTGLGKDSSGRVESIAESVSASGRVKSTAGVGVVELPQVHYTDSSFKGSLKQRTMARYEQIASTPPPTLSTSVNNSSS
jgi:RNA-binding protein 5/10